MKAISLWQPWASLWLTPNKIHETRRWPTKHRGWMAVHAAKRFEKDHPPELAAILRKEFGSDWYRTLPTGAIIGKVNIIDCIPTENITRDPDLHFTTGAAPSNLLCGDFAPGRFGWRRNTYQVFSNPIPFRGLQGIFNVPDELLLEAA